MKYIGHAQIIVPTLIFSILIGGKVSADNIAPEGQANGSSFYYNGTPSKINDGSYLYPEGSWSSGDTAKEPHWVSIIWDKQRSLAGASIFFLEQGKEKDTSWGKAMVAPRFNIQVLDGDKDPAKDESWVTVDTVTDNTASPYLCKFDGLKKTKGLRVYILESTPVAAFSDSAAAHAARIKEIEVWEGTVPFKVKPKKPGAKPAARFFQVEKPLFKELLGNEPASDKVLYWGYETYAPRFRESSKKFAHRYVHQEQHQEMASHPYFVNLVNVDDEAEYIKHGIPICYYRPSAALGMGLGLPKVFGDWPWFMDPRWQDEFVKQAIDNTKLNKYWGIFAGDEIWESFAIKPVPKAKWYPQVEAADKEIREKYGFGKYGMPDSDQDTNPFKRIAYRRWVSAKWVETLKKSYEGIKKVNPKIKVLGFDFATGVPGADIEEMSKYADEMSAQLWNSSSPLTQQLAVGCETKLLTDLSVSPTWGMVQIPTHVGAPTPEEVRERYSQVFRNGGSGLALYAFEFFDTELEHPKYSAPEKWRAILDVFDTATKMNKVKLPKADSAILYSSDSMLTLETGRIKDDNHDDIYSAYTVLGPQIGSWFNFVSDRQLDRGIKKLSDYKVLYITFAKYQRASVLDKIEEYVRNGGTVVCADPEAFSWNINGDPLSARWEKISGVKRGLKRGEKAAVAATTVDTGYLPKGKMEFDFHTPGFELKSEANDVRRLIAFEDGSPAATIRRYGKGTVIQFASNIFEASPELDSPYIDFFKKIQLKVGAKVKQDVWRFKLPPLSSSVFVPDTEKNVCLTNNNVVFELSEGKLKHNLDTGGSYRYDHFPTGMADVGKEGEEIPFTSGHLTDRPRAVSTRTRGETPVSAEIQKWIVSWNDEKPATITFDFKKDYSLNRAVLFYSGAFPALTAKGSNDNKTWQEIGAWPEKPATQDVIDLTVPLKGEYRFVQFELAARQPGQILEIPEIEIWGEEKK